MDLYPLPGQLLPDPVDTGWSRVVRHGPMTVAQVLERGRDEMKAQEQAEELERDPVAWVRAHRPRRFIDRLLGR